MIATISRSWHVHKLSRVLAGPGHSAEPTGRVLASWHNAPARHQPPASGAEAFDAEGLAATLAAPAITAGIPLREPTRQNGVPVPRGPVWHCTLRNPSADPVLTDTQWAEIVTDLMDRTQIAPHHDLGACRWVAITHADRNVHIAAMLIRQDNGQQVRPHNDLLRVRQICREADARLSLQSAKAPHANPR